MEGPKIKHCLGVKDFEGRNYPRFPYKFPIEYWRSTSSKSYLGYTNDISEGGLMASIQDQVGIVENLRIKLFLCSDNGLDPIEAIIKVIWVDSDAGKDGYWRIGGNFVDMLPGDREKLKGFLNEFAFIKDVSEIQNSMKDKIYLPNQSIPKYPGRTKS